MSDRMICPKCGGLYTTEVYRRFGCQWDWWKAYNANRLSVAPSERCGTCDGAGGVHVEFQTFLQKCPRCNGSGRRIVAERIVRGAGKAVIP